VLSTMFPDQAPSPSFQESGASCFLLTPSGRCLTILVDAAFVVQFWTKEVAHKADLPSCPISGPTPRLEQLIRRLSPSSNSIVAPQPDVSLDLKSFGISWLLRLSAGRSILKAVHGAGPFASVPLRGVHASALCSISVLLHMRLSRAANFSFPWNAHSDQVDTIDRLLSRRGVHPRMLALIGA
jgi:hypothetical protein